MLSTSLAAQIARHPWCSSQHRYISRVGRGRYPGALAQANMIGRLMVTVPPAATPKDARGSVSQRTVDDGSELGQTRNLDAIRRGRETKEQF